jgi:hypothetical protein
MINRGLIISFDDAEAAGQVSIRTTENPETVLISHGENRFPAKLSDIEDALYEIKEFHKVNAIVKQVQEDMEAAKQSCNCNIVELSLKDYCVPPTDSL